MFKGGCLSTDMCSPCIGMKLHMREASSTGMGPPMRDGVGEHDIYIIVG